MQFPKTPRVIFELNPLHEVICQLRYPAVLKIDAAEPAEFQERIRATYPLFEEEQQPGIDTDLPPEIRKVVRDQLQLAGPRRSFSFRTADGVWKVGLHREFLALSTSRYETWGDFTSHLQAPFEALVEVYQPAFIGRVGLRYRDLIQRSKLGLKGVPWSELIQPSFAGELADTTLAEGVVKAVRQVTIRLPDDAGFVQIKHGLGTVEGEDEECFVFDADFFTTERTEVTDAPARLDHFNELSGSLFRHCITDQLRDAMRPRTP